MGLFVNPVTLNDGSASRIFAFRSQVYDKKSVIGEYIESAADLSAESVLRVKHDPSASTPRHLLQRTVKRVPAADADAGLLGITVNLTITASKLFTDAEVATEVAILLDAAAEANVVKSMLNSLI